MFKLGKKGPPKTVPPRLLTEEARQRVFAKGTEQEREEFHEAARILNPRTCKARSRLAGRLEWRCLLGRGLGLSEYKHLPPIPREKGYVICRPAGFAPLQAALEEARQAFRDYNPGTNKREQDSLEGVPRSNRTFTSAINKLAMHPAVVNAASRYLGLYPVLYRINLLYSPNNVAYDLSSQFFHLDPEDKEQMKLFIWVEDVDAETGPFMLLPADLSHQVRSQFNYKKGRLSDENMFGQVKSEDVVVCTGQAGTMVFADTSRCFHMGSRQGTRPRYAIMIQYVTPFAAMFPLKGDKLTTMMGHYAIPARPSRAQKYLLGVNR